MCIRPSRLHLEYPLQRRKVREEWRQQRLWDVIQVIQLRSLRVGPTLIYSVRATIWPANDPCPGFFGCAVIHRYRPCSLILCVCYWCSANTSHACRKGWAIIHRKKKNRREEQLFPLDESRARLCFSATAARNSFAISMTPLMLAITFCCIVFIIAVAVGTPWNCVEDYSYISFLAGGIRVKLFNLSFISISWEMKLARPPLVIPLGLSPAIPFSFFFFSSAISIFTFLYL